MAGHLPLKIGIMILSGRRTRASDKSSCLDMHAHCRDYIVIWPSQSALRQQIGLLDEIMLGGAQGACSEHTCALDLGWMVLQNPGKTRQ